jgi:hypothetical protein
MLCDSNILIYAAESNNTMNLDVYLQHPEACIASVTKIEVLGFPGFARLDSERQDKLQKIVASLTVLPLDEMVIKRAITLRQKRKMSLGDTIIAATALVFDLPLVTCNYDDFKHIANLHIINPMK